MTPERFQLLKQVLACRQVDLTVLLDNIHKPHNLAAIIRTADATGILRVHGVGDIYLAKRRPKAASGSKRWTKLTMHKDCTTAIETLQQQGLAIVAADPCDTSIPFTEYDYTKPTAVVFGSELTGLSDYAKQNADAHVHVPMLGFTESLNVSVTAALILYEAMQQRMKKGMYQKNSLDDELYTKTLFEWTWPKLAHYCRGKNLPYPKFDLDTGDILETIPGSAGAPFPLS